MLIAPLFLIVSVVAAPNDADAWLVSDAQAAAQIVIADDSPRTTRLAAEQLQHFVEKISGGRLAIVTDPGDELLSIYVGESEHTRRLGLRVDDLDHGAYRMASGPRWLALIGRDSDYTPPEPYAYNNDSIAQATRQWDQITGETWLHPFRTDYKNYNREMDLWAHAERGSLNAVYGYLRSLGARWYMPGEWGEHLPQLASIPLPQVDMTVRPQFPMRFHLQYYQQFALTSREEILWQLRMGLNTGRDMLGGMIGHGIIMVTGREETRAAHPEYYALLRGERDVGHSAQACLSSPELVDANVRFARAYFDQFKDATAVSVMPADGFVMCQCELCKGKARNDRGFQGAHSDYVWSYVNRVATELYKTHPDHKVTCFAYTSYTLPPESIERFSPNVRVGICENRSNFYDDDLREKAFELRRQWLKRVSDKQLLFYKYYLHPRPGKPWAHIPVVFPRQVALDLRSAKDVSLGEFIEIYRRRDQVDELAVNHLNIYVTARMYWDVDQSVDDMLEAYYTLQYGPARSQMKLFFEHAQGNWMNMTSDPEVIATAFQLLDAAKAAAGEDTIHRRRIDLIADYIEPMRNLRKQLLVGRDDNPALRIVPMRGAEVTIDGRRDEPLWSDRSAYGWLADLLTGERPKNKTHFWIGMTDEALYLFIRCEDSDAPDLNITATEDGDQNIWLGDNVELLLETPSHTYYQLVFNPAGAMVDVDRSYGIDTLWSSGTEYACRIDDQGWNVELRIPFTNELQKEVDAGQGVAGRIPTSTFPWYFNIGRQRVRADGTALSAFCPTGKSTFHDRRKFARLYRK